MPWQAFSMSLPAVQPESGAADILQQLQPSKQHHAGRAPWAWHSMALGISPLPYAARCQPAADVKSAAMISAEAELTNGLGDELADQLLEVAVVGFP